MNNDYSYFMRTDSCRKCGYELKIDTKCNVCRKVNRFLCDACGHQTEKEIHANCLLKGLDNSSVIA